MDGSLRRLDRILRSGKLSGFILAESESDPKDLAGQRSYEEIKKEFDTLDFGVRTEAEIITELHKDYMQTKDDKRKVQILVDLEYYVHQIDNGLNFLKMGGLRDIIIPGLNSSFEDFRLNCAYVFGNCVQNNIKAQIMAYETKIIEILVRLIATDTVEVKNKCLYGLSVLCLQFPIAQKKLVESGALSEFALIVSQRDPILSKLQKKIIVFLYDLVLEPELTKQNLQYYQNQNETDNVEMYSEKLRQYNVSNIKGQLLANNWCYVANTYLKRVYEESITIG
ncbi:nucleotide exchange factor SIL1-like [Artemia franciscana]|uniref:nucleotide exchange factor SIL1-like n=1 Tax=Artemia franciscana TaxID=6661 RepID=UPI0032D9DEA0